jgi:hypothetical protein
MPVSGRSSSRSRASRRAPLGLSLTEAGRELGISKQAVSKLVRDGGLSTLDDGTLDPDTMRAEYESNVHPGRRGAPGGARQAHPPEAPGGPQSYARARTAKTALDAQIRQIELRRLMGELLDRAEVQSVAFAEARKSRDLVMGMCVRLAPIVASLTDPMACLRVMEEEARHVCRQMSGTVERKKS